MLDFSLSTVRKLVDHAVPSSLFLFMWLIFLPQVWFIQVHCHIFTACHVLASFLSKRFCRELTLHGRERSIVGLIWLALSVWVAGEP